MLFCILISAVSLHQTQEEGVKLCLHVLQSVFSAGGTTVKLTHLVVSQRKERHQTLIESTNLELFFAVWSTACVSLENRTIWLAHPALTHAGLLLRALFGQKPDSSCSMLCSETFVSHDFSFLCSVFCSLGSFLCFSWHPQCVSAALSMRRSLSLPACGPACLYWRSRELSHLCHNMLAVTDMLFVTTFQRSKCC